MPGIVVDPGTKLILRCLLLSGAKEWTVLYVRSFEW